MFSNTLSNDSIVLTNGQLIINKNLVIIGLSAKTLTLSGNNSGRIFFIATGNKLILQKLSLRGGFTANIHGGAVYNSGILLISQCYFYENYCKNSGGAVYNSGILEIEESTFAYNKADSNGGAIANILGKAEIRTSTFAYNYAKLNGGAFYQQAVNSVIPYARFSASTISENSTGGKGGGVCNVFINYLDTTKVVFHSSIVAKNTSALAWGHDIARGLSSRCYVNSEGNNLIGNSDSSGFQGYTGDVIGNSKSPVDPRLVPLAYNGGNTPTMALGCGSSALDFGDPFIAYNYDQRGYNRKFNGIADIGAFEAQKDMYIPVVELGKNIDTCLGINISFNTGRPTDSVNWLRPDKSVYLTNSKVLNFVSSYKDTIIAEVISPAGCAGYDTVLVRLKDIKAPVFQNCPANIKVYSPSTSCSLAVIWTPPNAIDECGIDTVFSNFKPNDIFQAGTTTVTYQAIDFAGNKANCSFKVTVTDTLKPSINKLANINSVNESDKCGVVVTYTPPVGTDNCAGAVTKQLKGLGSGAFFPVGKTEELYVVTDASGNTDTSRFYVNVVDIEDPVITPPANIIKNNDSGLCSAIILYNFLIATDNCPSPKLTLISGFASGSAFPKGKTDVLYRLSDSSGNYDTALFNVEIIDNEKPKIQCPKDIESCDSLVVYSLPVFTDNCPAANLSLVSGIGSNKVFPFGETTETYQVVDAVNNKNTCSFKVRVHPAPYLELGSDTFVYAGEQIQLKPVTADSLIYEWSPNTFIDNPTVKNPFVFPETKTKYYLKVTNKYNCFKTDSLLVDVKLEIFVPTIFTPGNRDSTNTNETWEIKGLKNKPDWEVFVFDSWGTQVFYSKSYNTPWDGTADGKELPQGAYIFVIDNSKDNLEPIKGYLTIIR